MFGDYQLESDIKGDINVVCDVKLLDGVVLLVVGAVIFK